MTAYTTLAWCHAVKMVKISNYRNKNTLTVILAATFQNRFIKTGRLLPTYLPWKSSEITRWHGWTERFTRILFGRNSILIFGRTTLSKVDRMRILEFGWRNGSLPWEWVSVRAAVSIASTVMPWTQCIARCRGYRIHSSRQITIVITPSVMHHAELLSAVEQWTITWHSHSLPACTLLDTEHLDLTDELWFYILLDTK